MSRTYHCAKCKVYLNTTLTELILPCLTLAMDTKFRWCDRLPSSAFLLTSVLPRHGCSGRRLAVRVTALARSWGMSRHREGCSRRTGDIRLGNKEEVTVLGRFSRRCARASRKRESSSQTGTRTLRQDAHGYLWKVGVGADSKEGVRLFECKVYHWRGLGHPFCVGEEQSQ